MVLQGLLYVAMICYAPSGIRVDKHDLNLIALIICTRTKDRSVAAGAPEGPLPSVLELGDQRRLPTSHSFG